MKCPKCTGLLIREDIREQSGRFQGWRCIQCGFRLDHRIVQNRTSIPAGQAGDDIVETSSLRAGSASQRRATSRRKRAASKA